MDVKRITCRSAIEAAALRAKLEEENIKSTIYDETNSKVARGILDQTVDVIVCDNDFERAKSIYGEMMKADKAFMPWCPSCGSENVRKQNKPVYTAKGLMAFFASVLAFLPFRSSPKQYVCNDCGKQF